MVSSVTRSHFPGVIDLTESGFIKPDRTSVDGVVLQAGWLDDLAGNGIILRHEQGWETRYFHMQSADLPVTVGDTVVAGQVIGAVGSTGSSTGPHLHFEIVYGPVRLDPMSGFVYLGREPGGPGADGERPSGGSEMAGLPGAEPNGEAGAAAERPAPAEVPAGIAEARRELTSIGADAVGMVSDFEARRAEERARSRQATLVLVIGVLILAAGAGVWWGRPIGERAPTASVVRTG